MALTGSQYEQFTQALLAAYDYDSLERMLRMRLNKHMERLVSRTNFEHQVFQVIGAAEREGWTYKLLLAARGYNPGNPRLFSFANSLGLVADGTAASVPALESMIRSSSSFLDAAVFRTLQGWVETAICRVNIGGKAAGTGFLVSPSVVMTNHHVLAAVIEGQTPPAAVACQFDYKRLHGGQVSQGVEYALLAGAGWLIAAAPPSPQEAANQVKSDPPTTAQLDFALVQLRDEIAHVALAADMPETIAATQGPPRAWLPFKATHDFVAGSPLWIVQHPHAEPLKLSLESDAVIGLNENGTRVAYKNNTANGSSGSPVFDQNWNLVALHHMGDPDWLTPSRNEGVPIATIRTYLESKNLLGVLGREAQ